MDKTDVGCGAGTASFTDVVIPPTGAGRIRLVLILGALIALGPLTIDMYLPALPTITSDLLTTEATVQLTLTGTLLWRWPCWCSWYAHGGSRISTFRHSPSPVSRLTVRQVLWIKTGDNGWVLLPRGVPSLAIHLPASEFITMLDSLRERL